MERKVIGGCDDCPFFTRETEEHNCNAKLFSFSNFRGREVPVDENGEPKTPNWCPLLEEAIIVYRPIR